MAIPAKPTSPSSTVVFEVNAASPAAIVTRTQRPPMVQVIKNQVNLVFITINRLSWPSFLILLNKKEPKRVAQMTIIRQIIISLISKEGLSIMAATTVETYESDPVKSK